ncbi:MAG: hypothetical protein HGA45_19485 [Chloroflexales bacterium]|nr:hypothetical protein [Chloroflexales bacterium]
MVSYGLFWLVVAVFIVGQALLVRAAWRLRKGEASLPPGVPRSHGGADLAWTLATAVLSGVMLYYAYLALV